MGVRDVPLDAIPEPALVVASDGGVVAANPAASERWDGAPSALADIFDDDATADAARAAIGDGEWREDCHLVADRERWTADVSLRPLDDGESLLVARDVSDERAAERSARMLDALLDEIPVSVYFKDADSRHVRVSHSLAADLRPNEDGQIVHTAEDVEGKTEYDLYPYDIAEPAVTDDQRVMATGEPIEGLVERVERPSGEIVYITTSKAPWYDEDGEIVGVLGVSVETTAQKRQAEELRRQNERLEEFASAVSHDLRNPLEVARANVELFRESGDETNLDTVARMHDRMSQLIEDTLELARGGELVTDPDPVDAASVVREAWDAVDTKDATLDCEWDGSIEADRSRLSRLLENCFRNAIEHAGADATVRVLPLDDGRTGFAIEDDGPGIPLEEREAVFDRGYTTSDEGTGFGLSIVGEIADAHGWSIRATESDAGGARFEIVTETAH